MTTSPRRRTAATISAILTAGMLTVGVQPAGAAATWTVSHDGSLVTVRATTAGTTTVTCAAAVTPAVVLVNGISTSARCQQVAELRIVGSAGNDRIEALGIVLPQWPALVRTVIDGKAGDDKIYGTTGDDVIQGGLGNDVVRDPEGSNVLRGGPGDDELVGGRRRDTIYGDDGTDRLVGCPQPTLDVYSHDLLYGGLGNDRIKGCAGNDTVQGNEGDDKIEGGAGNDLVSGGNGDDVIDGDSPDARSATDQLDGGPGTNTVMGNNDDAARNGARFLWTIDTTTPLKTLISGLTSDGVGCSFDLTIKVPGRWNAAPSYDGDGLALRRPDKSVVIDVGGMSSLTVHLSPGDDRLDVVPNDIFSAVVDGAAGNDTLGIGVIPGATINDDGATITGSVVWADQTSHPFNPISYTGFERKLQFPDPGR